MNLAQLQADLRNFAAERDWQPFHTPKNLSMALMVEVAELAEIFQWMTPQESQVAHRDPASKRRIGEEVADVLLYLLQVADHSQIDIAQVVKDKLAGNALKYPSKRTIGAKSVADPVPPDTHILLDYENVQPTEVELRAMAPDATKVWVFHGPHQKQVERRFTSYGKGMTPVPIGKTGKNALDFILSFYTGYIACRNQGSEIVIVANDKGYGPMLEHARAMGFTVHQLGHGRAKSDAPAKRASAAKAGSLAGPSAKTAAAKKTPVKKASTRQVAAKTAPAPIAAAKRAPSKSAPAKSAAPAKKPAAKTTALPRADKLASAGQAGSPKLRASPPPSKKSASPASGSADLRKKLTDNLRKMGDKRPGRSASLRRLLKSLLGTTASENSTDVALRHLIAAGIVAVDSAGGVSYPGLAATSGAGSARA